MASWDTLADEASTQNAIRALTGNGITAFITENAGEAKKKVFELIPPGSEVMTMTSATLEAMGISDEINKTDGTYKPVRDTLYAMDRNTQKQDMNRLGGSPLFAIGSAQAVTQDGHVLIASNTGSQIPAYAYGALHVIWVVGTQKIVKNIDEGIKRIYEHCLPLESERAKKAYGMPGSAVNKILIVYKEIQPGRVTLIFVREKLGF